MHSLKVPPPNPSLVPPPDEVSSTGRIQSLTGLRFIAALLVFVHHLDGRFGFEGSGLPLANNAVSFFFVLSGFILSLVYGRRFDRSLPSNKNAADGTSQLVSFLKKRVARLWPLHFVCLLICVATVRYLNLDFWPIVSNLFLVHAWIPDSPYVFGLNNVSWSISTELFFCFAFPFLVIGGYRGFLWRYGALILGTIGCLVLMDCAMDAKWVSRWTINLTVQANPLIRLFEFATGVLTAYLFTRSPRSTASSLWADTAREIGTLALVFAWWAIIFRFNILALVPYIPLAGNSLGIWIWFCSAGPLFGLVVWTFARSNGLIAKLMGSRAMVHLGEISFAFYMIHMLVIRVIDAEGDPILITGTLAIALSLVASLAAAELLFQLVEMPGKDGMIALLNGRPLDSVVKTTTAITRVVLKPLTAIALVGLIAVAGFVHHNSSKKYEQSKIYQIVQNSSEAHKQVEFVDASTLKGCLLKIDDDSIKVELAWQAAGPHTENRRKIYLMDQKMTPLNSDTMAWYRHNSAYGAFADGEMYDVVEFDRKEYPNLHRIMLAWEGKHGERAPLSKNGTASQLELLELHCVDPGLAAIDTLSLPAGKLRSLIEQMPREASYIRLGKHATLCGYECVKTPEGALDVNLAWKLKPELIERRVLNFLDDQMAVVGNFGNVELFRFVRRMKGPEERLFLDQISIPSDRWVGASTVTVGLWNEQEKKMVKLDLEKGKTVNKGQRLIIGHLNPPAQESGQSNSTGSSDSAQPNNK